MDPKRFLLDIEVQSDFFSPGGALYRPASAIVRRRIYRLFNWVRAHDICVMSTVLRVRPNDRGPFGDVPHCVEGARGERKLAQTILPRRIDLGLFNSTDLPVGLFNTYQQVIFEKRDVDIFVHARAERLLTELPDATFFLCGAGISRGILAAAVGLRSRGFGVVLVRDAVIGPDRDGAEMAFLRMAAKGVVFATTEEIVSPRPAKVCPGCWKPTHARRPARRAVEP